MANCAIPAILGLQFQLLKCQIFPPISLANHIRENYLVFFYSTEGIFLSGPFKARFFFTVLEKQQYFGKRKKQGMKKVLFNFSVTVSLHGHRKLVVQICWSIISVKTSCHPEWNKKLLLKNYIKRFMPWELWTVVLRSNSMILRIYIQHQVVQIQI